MAVPMPIRLLIVDDETEILFSLQGLLRREFTLLTAASGMEALEILREQPVDIIMSDQRMPLMTGTELLKQVRRQWPQVARILFTGYADSKAVIEAINTSGLFRYITKPWDPDDLIDVLQAAATFVREQRSKRELIAELQTYLEAAATWTTSSPEAAQKLPPEWAAHARRAEELSRRLQEMRALLEGEVSLPEESRSLGWEPAHA